MHEPTSKAELLEAINREHEALTQTIDYLSVGQMTMPGIYADNDWTAKDILTHVAAWEQLQLRWMQQKRAGEPLDPPPSVMWQNAAGMNVDFHTGYRDYSVEQAWDAFDHSFEQILDEIEATDEAILLDPTPYDPSTEHPLLAHIVANTYEHYAEHTSAVMTWREREGL